MSATFPSPHVVDQERQQRQLAVFVYAACVSAGLLIALFAKRRLTEPFLGVSLALILLLLIGWTIRPRATLNLVLFLTAVSDIVTVSWFPFVKNLSSRESISFVADALTISPLDLALFLGFVVTTVITYANTGRPIRPSALGLPVLVVTAFVVFGFVRGVAIAGGDLRIAVLEGRPMFYLGLTFGIVVNVCTEAAHLRRAFWWLLAGVVVQVLLSVDFLNRIDPARQAELESLNEHGSALGHNLIILTVAGLFLFGARTAVPRLALLPALVPTAIVYLAAQRRSGVAALGVAIVFVLIVLFWRRRTLFFVVAPIVLIGTLGYLAAFWNSTSSAAFPAQAVKSVVAPQSASAADQSSDLYRMMESYDLVFTVRTDPLKGIGFGRPFYQPVPLPALESFELAAYQAHNSILWLWLKLGFIGFAATFWLIGRSVMLGARRVRDLDAGADLVVTLSAVLFIIMYTVYTFVDISWDARNMVFLGLAIAICAAPVPPSSRRSRQSVRASTHAGQDAGVT